MINGMSAVINGKIGAHLSRSVIDVSKDWGGKKIENVRINLIQALASDHIWLGTTATLTAGEALVIGDVCYAKSDGKMWKADADAAATMPVVAMATGTIAADATGEFLLLGYIRDDTWNWTVGGLLYAHTTPGNPTQTAPSGTGDQVQVLGVAVTADIIFFCPSLELVEIS